MTRFLLLHPKSADEDEIRGLVSSALAILTPLSRGRPFELMTGREFFDLRFKAAGSWDAWANEAGAGVNPITREPLFHGFLVPGSRVGAGTARVVAAALMAGKRVFVFRSDGSIARARLVARTDPEDWRTGWTLGVGPYWIAGEETESHA